MRHARDQPEQPNNSGGEPPGFWKDRQLRDDLITDIDAGGDPTDNDTRRRRDDERGDLRHEPVADGQQRIGLAGLGQRQLMLPDADDQPADQVDKKNKHRGNRIAAHEFAGTVHRAEKIGFASNLLAPPRRLFLIDLARVEIRVDRHLLARHTVQGKARRDLGDAPSTLGDHNKIDDHEDREDSDTDGIIATDEKSAERSNDAPGRLLALITLHQDDTRRRDV